ncbi:MULTISPECIES: vanadium-dependent haloperoxidase [unclassified Micromonospora]|uniref:vanadium-dependent haloperoxidase n=1 Tax=unclassified Micromonospora TaxID=2617518 RepID=UPI0022B6018B|nr:MULTISPECIES: vanadium-dependent haloperoxidase [unclassified Micromonospora]MCZ7419380.1 vanadium-dependent haloperoxidase [Verrucosispora sp. WMMA2121]WBB93024.1 vanadium-dependent haloperoxidase [Verrucosispora sp. WMMC514]
MALTAVSLGTVAAVAPAVPASAAGPADHVLYWNDVLLRTYRQEGGAPGPLARAGAMVHGAIYDAANSALCATGADRCLGQQYRIKVTPTPGVTPDLATAIDYAAYDVLRSVYPQRNFSADLAAAQEGIASSPARTDGQRIGSASAQAMISFRVDDGAPDFSTYTDGTVPGQWRRTGSGAPATPSWGLVRPFAMTSNTQFRPGPPAGHSSYATLLASQAYADQLNEVKGLGRYDSSTRTNDQTQAAWFWANDLDGTYKPPGQLFAHTQIVAKAAKLTQAGNARLFGLVGIAMGDAAIVAWDAKYQTDVDLWRPETAIQRANEDARSDTVADPAWLPLSADRNNVRFSPAFPAYTSGHATFGAAWAGAMRGFFGADAFSFAATTEDPHAVGVVRNFSTFSAAATENARSRIWLGVHYQFDADSGISSGTALANHVTASVLRPTASYTFDGFYENGAKVGTSIPDAAAPSSFTVGFKLTAGSTPVTDPGAVVGASWNGQPATAGAVTFANGRYDIAVSVPKSCAGRTWTFTVLLRDGSRRDLGVRCSTV